MERSATCVRLVSAAARVSGRSKWQCVCCKQTNLRLQPGGRANRPNLCARAPDRYSLRGRRPSHAFHSRPSFALCREGTQFEIARSIAGSAGKVPEGAGPQITFVRSGATVSWDQQFLNLHELAMAFNIPVRWLCWTDVCHTCECSIIAG